MKFEFLGHPKQGVANVGIDGNKMVLQNIVWSMGNCVYSTDLDF